VLVKLEGIGGDWEGTLHLWRLEPAGNGGRDVYFESKQGRHTQRYVALTFRADAWELYPPGRSGGGIHLSYSADESKRASASELLKATTKSP
jgi:hypothetical protein